MTARATKTAVNIAPLVLLAFSACSFAHDNSRSQHSQEELRVRNLIIVDESGDEVAWFKGLDGGAVLSMGGERVSAHIVIVARNLEGQSRAEVLCFSGDPSRREGRGDAGLSSIMGESPAVKLVHRQGGKTTSTIRLSASSTDKDSAHGLQFLDGESWHLWPE
ncbi:MAG: hypothetical protein KDB80_17675 [Planctomycetes bacterium]|nr:hypothetical protein [Planctomycetota bacterium]